MQTFYFLQRILSSCKKHPGLISDSKKILFDKRYEERFLFWLSILGRVKIQRGEGFSGEPCFLWTDGHP